VHRCTLDKVSCAIDNVFYSNIWSCRLRAAPEPVFRIGIAQITAGREGKCSIESLKDSPTREIHTCCLQDTADEMVRFRTFRGCRLESVNGHIRAELHDQELLNCGNVPTSDSA
jgi:hypothetical protein